MKQNELLCRTLQHLPPHSLVIVTLQSGKQIPFIIQSYDKKSGCIVGIHNRIPIYISSSQIIAVQILPNEYTACFDEDICDCNSDFTINTAGLEQGLFYDFIQLMNKTVVITLVNKQIITGILSVVGGDFVEIRTNETKPFAYTTISFSRIVSVNNRPVIYAGA